MHVLNTLYVTQTGSSISAKKDALEVRAEGRLAGRFPLRGLDAVLTFGRVEASTEAIARCVATGTRYAALTANGRLRFQVGGGTSGNVLLRTEQHRWADDIEATLRLARTFVAGKLQNEYRIVNRWASNGDSAHRRQLETQAHIIATRLDALSGAKTGDHLRGLEGDAARRYFKALGAHLAASGASWAFLRRTRRPPQDPVNCVLSFLYSMLTSEIVAALEAVGLDPQIGYLHGRRPGRPSLALDLIEELRTPLVDAVATKLLARRQLRDEHFATVAGHAWYLTDEGRRQIFAQLNAERQRTIRHTLLGREIERAALPAVQATLLARHLRGDIADYPPFVMER